MYTWDDSMDDWARPGAYRFDSARSAERAAAASASHAAGGRSYVVDGPDEGVVSPRKHIVSQSAVPLVVAVDVTGSMARWPAEIFDRLPLLYNTLSQYRPELEVSFAAIGDAHYDRWPLQTTAFAKGYTLETNLKAIYGEGGGGDEPESYELFAWWMLRHVTVSTNEKPFLIVFGDAPMHPKVKPDQVKRLFGDTQVQEQDAITTWREVARKWETWFLRRAGRRNDAIDKQWGKAVGAQFIVHVEDEQRAVDYAMGLIARRWGFFEDFRTNMAARQDAAKIASLERSLSHVPVTRTA